MTTYKAISKWIAEGKERSELIGYVARKGHVIKRIEIHRNGDFAVCGHPESGIEGHYDFNLLVAPPQPKRVSDEELVDNLISISAINNAVDETPTQWELDAQELRAQILERMKAKGPTRGEVRKQLSEIVNHAATEAHGFGAKYGLNEAIDTFLSMFPEGE